MHVSRRFRCLRVRLLYQRDGWPMKFRLKVLKINAIPESKRDVYPPLHVYPIDIRLPSAELFAING